jgi:hypothetical protein
MSSPSDRYKLLVETRLSEPSRGWFVGKFDGLSPASFAVAYAGAGRRLGDPPAALLPSELTDLEQHGLLAPDGWPLRSVGRCALLMRVLPMLAAERQPEFVREVFQQGDNGEREALLASLSMLPQPERFLETAIDACRSHVQSVFEAIACENPYPARHFPDLNFNQLVLKAFFTEVAVKRIVGLTDRLSPELTRMANDYASERRAAGRPVPPDLDQVTLPQR